MPGHDQPIILIAEDNENDVFMLRRAFQQGGILSPLYFVSDGAQAIAYLKGEGKYARRDEYPLPDLLLLDLKMPGTDGFEVLKWVRSQPSLSPLRIVVLTTSQEIRDINKAYRLGANSFLTKPLDFIEFKDSIQTMYNYWAAHNQTPQISRPPRQTSPFNS